MGKAIARKTQSRRVKIDEDMIEDLYAFRNNIKQPPTVNIPSTGPSAPGLKQFLLKNGDRMMGALAFNPADVIINATGHIDISPQGEDNTSLRDDTSYILMTGNGTPDDLNWIDGAQFNGQLLVLQGTASQVLNIIHATTPGTNGNIVTSDGTDVTLDGTMATNGIPVAQLIFDVTVGGGGAWRLMGGTGLGGGSGGGANVFLSNLQSPTSVNQNVIPQAGKTLGSSGSEWASMFTNSVRLGTAGTIGATNNQIIADATNGMEFNVPSGDIYRFYVAGVAGARLDNALFDMTTFNSNIKSGGLQLYDFTTPPITNGEFRRDGADVFVFSGGASRNLSTIGAAGGANVFLSNLTSPTDINQHLLPQAGKNLGVSGGEWASMFTNSVRLGTAGTMGATNNQIIADATNGMEFNVPSGDIYRFHVAAVPGARLDNALFDMTSTSSNIKSGGFQLYNFTSDPITNGEFRMNGTDVKVFTGGVVKNLSDIGGANTTLSNLVATVAVNQDLSPDGSDTRHFGTSTFYWTDLHTKSMKMHGTHTTPITTDSTGIYKTATGMDIHVTGASDIIKYLWNGASSYTMSPTQFNMSGALLDNALGITLNDFANPPIANGEFRLDGADVKVFTGGVVKNLSDSGGPEFADDVFKIFGSIGPTRKLAFEVDGVSAGFTRTWTAQNADGVVALLNSGLSQVFFDEIHSIDTLNSFKVISTALAPATNTELGRFTAFGNNLTSTNESINYTRIVARVGSNTVGAEGGRLLFQALDESGGFGAFFEIQGDFQRTIFSQNLTMFGGAAIQMAGNDLTLDTDGDSKFITSVNNVLTLDLNASPAFVWSATAYDIATKYMQLSEIGDPGLAPANAGRIFLDTSDNTLKVRKEAGVAISLEGGGGSAFADNVFEVFDDITSTKKITFSLATATGTNLFAIFGTSDTYTFPNGGGTFVMTQGNQTVGGAKTFSTTLTASSTFTVNGTANLDGATTNIDSGTINIGNSTGDNLAINARCTTDFDPDGSTQDIGNTTQRWNDGFFQSLNLDNGSVTATAIQLTDSGGIIDFDGNAISVTASAGSITPPSQVLGYINAKVGGTNVRIPYYNT